MKKKGSKILRIQEFSSEYLRFLSEYDKASSKEINQLKVIQKLLKKSQILISFGKEVFKGKRKLIGQIVEIDENIARVQKNDEFNEYPLIQCQLRCIHF